jgi:hypothetical protein
MVYFGIDGIGLRRLQTRGCQVATASKPDTPSEVAVQGRAVKVVIAWVFSKAKIDKLQALMGLLVRRCVEAKGMGVLIELGFWTIATFRAGRRSHSELFRTIQGIPPFFQKLVAPKAQQQPQP